MKWPAKQQSIRQQQGANVFLMHSKGKKRSKKMFKRTTSTKSGHLYSTPAVVYQMKIYYDFVGFTHVRLFKLWSFHHHIYWNLAVVLVGCESL